MKAEIRIDRLRVRARHGVLPQERSVGNDFEVSVVMTVDYDGSDRLESTVNYAEAIDLIKEEMALPSSLIEHVAARIGKALKQRFPQITGGSVTVFKPCPPVSAALGSVSVTLPI